MPESRPKAFFNGVFPVILAAALLTFAAGCRSTGMGRVQYGYAGQVIVDDGAVQEAEEDETGPRDRPPAGSAGPPFLLGAAVGYPVWWGYPGPFFGYRGHGPGRVIVAPGRRHPAGHYRPAGRQRPPGHHGPSRSLRRHR